MTKLALDSAQKLRLAQAHENGACVLRQLKQNSLKGEALSFMKDLESAVQTLEVLVMQARRAKEAPTSRG